VARLGEVVPVQAHQAQVGTLAQRNALALQLVQLPRIDEMFCPGVVFAEERRRVRDRALKLLVRPDVSLTFRAIISCVLSLTR
jgi:hypothetical protein